jgi:beta-glucosidase
VANDAETDRFTVDNRVDERTLRELYLAPFEAVVSDADPWMVMAAYNAVNGAPMTENDLLEEPLKGEWGFDGVVVSDWGALYDGERGARAALDLTMPGPEEKWAEPLVEAVRAGRVPEAAIDAKLRRLLRLAARTGALESAPAADKPSPGRIEDASSIAREAAAAAAVLLSNDGLLPLDRQGLRRVAVLGPGARDARPLGGGSASVPPAYVRTPLAGISAALGGQAEVVSAVGAVLSEALRAPRPDELSGPTVDPAATLRWLDEQGGTVLEQHAGTATIIRILADAPEGATALEISTGFTADEDGDWRIGVTGRGDTVLVLDGETVLEARDPGGAFDIHEVFAAPPQHATVVPMRAGERVDVRIRYRWPADGFIFKVGLVVGPPLRPADEELAHAVELARTSDVAVVVVGTSDAVESEGFDRTSLTLPGRQDELVRAVAAVNPRTVVVVNAGSPVELPWRDEVGAVLVVWFPGMEFGNALADVLLGAVEPGGRLPTTWPATMADAPVLSTTPTEGRLEYTEALAIGHRACVAAGIEPAYWFGHGLGYTTWEFEAIEAPAQAGPEGLTATVRVRNTGDRRGKQVVQVYASRPGSPIDRPVRWLAGFAVVSVAPGAVAEVPVTVGPRALRHWHATAHGWAVEPGEVVLSVGPDAGHQEQQATVTLQGPA